MTPFEGASRRQNPRRAVWIARRARNAPRARLVVGVVGAVAFLATFVTIALTARRPLPSRPAAGVRPDTVEVRRALDRTLDARDSLIGALGAARDSLAILEAAPPPPRPDSALLARRDSLAGMLALVGRAIDRTESSPLAESYRALGEMPTIRGERGVSELLDSLTLVERERQAYGAVGGVDPMFVALTARIGLIGRSLRDIAERRRREIAAALREVDADIAASRPPPRPPIDTASIRRARDSAGAAAEALARRLAADRRALESDDRAALTRRSVLTVPALALLAGSAALAAFVALAVALALELRSPRIAEAAEAEEVCDARVIARLEAPDVPLAPSVERRKADGVAVAEGFRRAYLFLSGGGTSVAVVTLTSADDPMLSARVACGIAFAAAREGRGTLLIDTDAPRSPVARILRIAGDGGLAAIAAGDAGWPESLVPVPLGRDHTLDLVAAGGPIAWTEERSARIRDGLARMARRYDIVTVNLPPALLAAPGGAPIPGPDIVLCLVLHRTRIRAAAAVAESVRQAGRRVAGLILWEGDRPPDA